MWRKTSLVVLLGLFMRASSAEQNLLLGFRTSKSRISEKDSSCVSVAAELGPCLSAVSPLSRLTTMEEADCCTTLLLFKEADCYCLAPETMEELSNADQCALGKRLSQLAEASQRCGWGGFTCSESETAARMDVEATSEKTSSADSKDLEADMTRFYGGSVDQPRQGGGGHAGPSQSVRSFESEHNSVVEQGQSRRSRQQIELEMRDVLVTHMTTYMRQVVKLTEALSIEQGDEVDLTVEVTMGLTNYDTSADTSASEALWGVPWLSLFILALLATLLIRISRRASATLQPPTPRGYAAQGIAVAAEEVHDK